MFIPPRHFLAVCVLALLLLPLLLACATTEPADGPNASGNATPQPEAATARPAEEPADGPDANESATPQPETATAQPTGSQPTATTAPTEAVQPTPQPAATAQPTQPTSASTDKDALVALYNAAGGPH